MGYSVLQTVFQSSIRRRQADSIRCMVLSRLMMSLLSDLERIATMSELIYRVLSADYPFRRLMDKFHLTLILTISSTRTFYRHESIYNVQLYCRASEQPGGKMNMKWNSTVCGSLTLGRGSAHELRDFELASDQMLADFE